MADKAHFIFYVRDQGLSATFYAEVLGTQPRLHVPGMTEFELGDGLVLGLMPQANAHRLLGDCIDQSPSSHDPKARAELYLHVDEVRRWHDRALAAGARELSAPAVRDWGHEAAYSLDPDGHVLAFARAL